MNDFRGLNLGLGALPLLGGNIRTRSISAENPTGEKGKGGMAVPKLDDPYVPHGDFSIELGQKWKARPFLKPKAGETVTLMDVEGSGIIQHIWLATEPTWQGHGRACILRFYWDDEEIPSVEVPMTDFFAVGHDIFAPVNSLAITVIPAAALNCYWPMPYRRHARITFTNESNRDLHLLAYQITYAETEVPDNAAYFHAQWRRAVTDEKNPDYTIIDGVRGSGKYVGTFLAWTQLNSGWFGEGEIKFFIDGDKEFPTICGTGTEDYFCGSYCFPSSYTNAYVGNVLEHKGENGPPKWSLYRWHIMDPIYFDDNLRITIQTLGWWPYKKFKPLSEDIASVAYWYQNEPHMKYPTLPSLNERWPR